ncbi:MAG: DoxX family protein [Gemmatimonadales bacterium]
MTSPTATAHMAESASAPRRVDLTRFIVPLARLLFAAIFIMASLGHFSQQGIGYGAQEGVPLASVLVPLSGVMSLVGGLSVLLGYRARIGAWLLVVFLIPVTIIMHDFWAVEDAAMAQLQQVMFLKNLALLGGALFIARYGAGPFSLDAVRRAERGGGE